MSEDRIDVVHLEDDPADAELVREALRASGLSVDLRLAGTREEFTAALRRRAPRLILSDYNLPSFDGLSALKIALELCPGTPFLFVSGTIGEDRAVDVLKHGATDYVLKTKLEKLPLACRRALKEAEEHRQAGESDRLLRAGEERYRRLVEEIPGVFFTGRFSEGRGVWTFVSRQIERLLGFSAEEVAGNPDFWWSRVHEEDRPGLGRALEGCVRAGRPVEHEHRLVHRDGRTVWVRAGVQPERVGGADLRGIVSDVTERRRIEEQFLQAQKMELVGSLAGGVAHDFNNLLTVINGYAELLLASTAPDPSARADLEEIFNAGKRAAALTRQLLAFSRKQVVQPTLVDVNALLTGLLKMLGRLVGEDLRIEFTPGPGSPFVVADPGQLEQVILNLVVNARDAMPRGGRIGLESSLQTLEAAPPGFHLTGKPGPCVRLSVTDAGAGMSDVVKARLFEPFYTTKAKGKGTGLGLSTVHSIVKEAGGAIRVESEPGRGSSFHVYFPAGGEQAVDLVVPEAPTSIRGCETILVAEDQEAVRRLIRVVLEGAGYRVLLASDGTEALRLAEERAEPIHLLVTDVVMRSLSGPELAELLRRAHPEARVLFVSGYPDRVKELGPDEAFLQKPFNFERFRSLVRELLDAPRKETV